MLKPKYLYHGSQYKLDIIKPHTASGLKEENGTEFGIYAYENIKMTIPFTLAIKTYDNGNKSFSVDDDTGIITIYAGILDENAKGYIYKLKSETFEKIDDKQWLSKTIVIPDEVIEVNAKDYMNLVEFKGSSKEIRQISKSIACCGLVCQLCHLADNCNGCRSEQNCCGARNTPEGCYQYNCCQEKKLDGCWECKVSPCDKGMFSNNHDLRLRAFIEFIKENGKDKLSENIYNNMQKNIYYGHGKDYDNLENKEAVLKMIKMG